MTLLLTGGSGRLGTELRKLLPNASAPGRNELEVTDAAQVRAVVARLAPSVILHAAAFTDVAGAEREIERAWAVNVRGTENVLAAAGSARVLFISTDYVFAGDRGDYRESDPVGPFVNAYAMTKAFAEARVLARPGSLVIRTSFRPSVWPHPVAFDDLFTSQDYVDVIAPLIARAILGHASIPDAILHIATERKSVFELVRRPNQRAEAGKRASASVCLPSDVSLNTERWQSLAASLPPLPRRGATNAH